MRTVLILLCVFGATLAATPLRAADPKPAPLAGWLGVIPKESGYQRTFQEPVVNKEKTVYQQTVEYSWMGNDYRIAKATLARDPAFKTAHTAEALKKLDAKAIKIGKKDAWTMPGGKSGDFQMTKIIVPLGEDKALIIEGVGVAHKAYPTELAGAFDPDKCAAALAQPPRTDFGRKIEDFKGFKKDMLISDVTAWLGEPDTASSADVYIMEYKLPDKSRVLIGCPSFDKLKYVKHEKDGKTEDLLK
jgi:hypothetical protein